MPYMKHPKSGGRFFAALEREVKRWTRAGWEVDPDQSPPRRAEPEQAQPPVVEAAPVSPEPAPEPPAEPAAPATRTTKKEK